MKPSKIPFMLSGVSLAILLASCGGGGGTDTTTTSTATTSSITGTVPGTLIEAFCADGTYYKVNSKDDGSSEHPFSLSLPNNVDCRLVMTTNEDDFLNRVITSIQINSGSVTSGLINMSADFDFGYIPLAMSRDDLDRYGKDVDGDGDGVADLPLEITMALPDGVFVRDLDSTVDHLDKDKNDIPDYYDDDDDDGVFNHEDSDDDNNKTYDIDEPDNHDYDGDGIDDLDDRDDDNDGFIDASLEPTSIAPYSAVTNYTLSTGRLLVSQCAQCHGTNGRSVTNWDSITDEANELTSEMFDDEPIMTAQAHGYSSAEISAMASWLGGLSNVSGVDSDGDDD
jgi:cytochrome c553